ncbi:spinster family MFS transporter [Lentilitoribacter sp. EG35]|uniref:spinster family MFS transporter n=1 Tax=Lentilitoribacter sp. EG35 TaxID=3234192 RepID=UPI00345F469B
MTYLTHAWEEEMGPDQKTGSRSLLYSLTGAFSLSYLDRQILNITLNDIGVEFNLTDLQLGSLSGIAFAIVYVFFGFPIARITKSGNRKKIVVIALSLWSGMTILMGTAGSYTMIFLARMGVGVGESGCVPPSHSMIVDSYPPEKRASALSFYSAGNNIGVFFAFLIGGILASQFGWRTAFFVAGVPGLLLALFMFFTLREPIRPSHEKEFDQPRISYKQLLKLLVSDQSTLHTLIGAALTAMTAYGAVSWVSVFLIRSHGLSIVQVGIFLAFAIGVAGALGTWLGGVVCDQLGKKNPTWRLKFVAISILITKPFSILFYLLDHTSLALSVFIIPAVASAMFAGPTFSHLYSRVAPTARPMVTAIFMCMVNLIGLGLGPILVGLISDLLSSAHGDQSLRYALATLQSFALWAAIHFWLAGRLTSENHAAS